MLGCLFAKLLLQIRVDRLFVLYGEGEEEVFAPGLGFSKEV